MRILSKPEDKLSHLRDDMIWTEEKCSRNTLKKLVYIKHYVPGRLGFLRQLFFVNIATGGPKTRPFQQ